MEKMNKCKLCGKSSFSEQISFVGTTLRYRNLFFVYARCKTCNSIVRLSKVSVNYIDYVTSRHIPKLQVNRFAKFLTHHDIQEKMSILDYGCGNGSLLSELRKMGYVNLKGYEPYNAKFSETLETGKFSLVYLIHVFEHLANLKTLFAEFKKVTNVKSKIIVICPSSTRIPKLNPECPFQRFVIHAPFHTIIPSDQSIIDLFAKNKYCLESYLPYDVSRSGVISNNKVSVLLQQALGGTKEKLLNATPMDKITSASRSPLAFFDSMFLHTLDPFVSTFVFKRTY